jgi:hypothetical protein
MTSTDTSTSTRTVNVANVGTVEVTLTERGRDIHSCCCTGEAALRRSSVSPTSWLEHGKPALSLPPTPALVGPAAPMPWLPSATWPRCMSACSTNWTFST